MSGQQGGLKTGQAERLVISETNSSWMPETSSGAQGSVLAPV